MNDRTNFMFGFENAITKFRPTHDGFCPDSTSHDLVRYSKHDNNTPEQCIEKL